MQNDGRQVAPTWVGKRQSRAAEMFRTTLAPLLLVMVTPGAVILLYITCTYLDGSLLRLLTRDGLATIVQRFPHPSWAAAKIILVFATFELALLQLLPGETYEGPVTPTGHRPRYKLNAMAAWFITHAAFFGASYGLGWFSPGIVYEHLGELLITLCVACFVLCWGLYFKGIYAPSTSDSGTSGSVILDYFQGVELHPAVLGVNLKQFFNCRISMMGWSLTVLSFAAYQRQELGHVATSMLVTVVLQVAYLFEFFSWEGGYFATLDVMHDRFGYYICWGVLAWVPGVYTITAQYLVKHPRELGWPTMVALLTVGAAAIWAGHTADAQRKRVRGTGGDTTVWGKAPEMIHAEYTTADGEKHRNILLVSGFWGVARHFHYVPELTLALTWSLPAGASNFLPYFYLMFLTILLVDRAGRDDLRCRTKYGKFWDDYCRRVPYKILPGIY
jgi:7-dehydrocholesterol reductase